MKNLLRTTAFSLLALGVGVQAQAQSVDCNASCLTDIAKTYMKELSKQDYSGLPWGNPVRYSENNVGMMIGEGFWGAGPSVIDETLILPDPETGNVLWYGITGEHGQAAYSGIRLKVQGRKIVEVEGYHGREGTPDLFAPTDSYTLDRTYTQNLRNNERSERERMEALVDGWFNSRQLNDGEVFTRIADNCVQITNGVNVTSEDHWAGALAQNCKAQLEQGLYKPVDRIRARRYPVINAETGVVVALSLEDHAARYVDYTSTRGVPLKVEVEYPNTRAMLQLFKIRNGQIERVDGISVFSPYYIQSLWKQ